MEVDEALPLDCANAPARLLKHFSMQRLGCRLSRLDSAARLDVHRAGIRHHQHLALARIAKDLAALHQRLPAGSVGGEVIGPCLVRQRLTPRRHLRARITLA